MKKFGPSLFPVVGDMGFAVVIFPSVPGGGCDGRRACDS